TVLMLLSLGVFADPTKPEYEFTTKNKEDSITLVERDKQTVFVIKSKSGIGAGTIKLKAGEFPQEVVIRFEYVDRGGFTVLESFGLKAGRFQVLGSQGTSGAMRFYLTDDKGKFDTKAVTGTLNVAVEKRDKALEATLPANLLLGLRELDVSWIDAF